MRTKRAGRQENRSGQQWFELLRRWRMLVFALVALAGSGLTQMDWFRNFDFVRRLENIALDTRYSARGVRAPNPNIVIIGIDTSAFNLRDYVGEDIIEASPALQLMHPQWPWNRAFFGLLAERLLDEAGARAVAYDLVFAFPNPGDAALQAALTRYSDQVSLGSLFLRQEDELTGGVRWTYIEPEWGILPESVSDFSQLIGYTNVYPDFEIDKTVRRAHHNYDPTIVENPELALIEGFLEKRFSLSYVAASTFAGYLLAAPPSDRSNLIDFAGPAQMYPTYMIEDVFLPGRWETLRRQQIFKDKLVFVGPLSEVRFKDSHLTPMGVMPGVEIHANMAASLLEQSHLSDMPVWNTTLLTFLLALAVMAICLHFQRALYKALLLVSLGIIFILGSQISFNEWHTAIPVTGPFFAIALCGSFFILYDFTLEQYERSRLRSYLERYVTENVANLILSNRSSFEEMLLGKRQRVTILFTDIRGFTTLSETIDPEVLVAQLNEYFLEMVDVVRREGGTLQKFIGDAIMAVWGDTHSQGAAEDARSAVRCALAMTQALRGLNERWKEQDNRLVLKIGIGINHGEAIVGNIGHPRRMEFTVLGDPVNLASRLEGATKTYFNEILVGESVHELTKDMFAYRLMDFLQVKGKRQAVKVYEPLWKITSGDSETSRDRTPRIGQLPRWLDLYNKALDAYRDRDFEIALAGFAEAGEACREAGHVGAGKYDHTCALYQERCVYFMRNPPPDDWDGAFEMKTK